MLDINAAKRIGINACIEKIGRDFVIKNKDFATSAYGESDDGVFCFVGVDDHCTSNFNDSVLVLDNKGKFQYHVSCNVNLVNGETTFIESVVPTRT